MKETREVIPVKDGDPIVETTLTFKLHEQKGALDSLGKRLGIFRERDAERAEHVYALLKAILVVLQKYLPAEKIELAIIELGRETDIA